MACLSLLANTHANCTAMIATRSCFVFCFVIDFFVAFCVHLSIYSLSRRVQRSLLAAASAAPFTSKVRFFLYLYSLVLFNFGSRYLLRCLCCRCLCLRYFTSTPLVGGFRGAGAPLTNNIWILFSKYTRNPVRAHWFLVYRIRDSLVTDRWYSNGANQWGGRRASIDLCLLLYVLI